jgi:integrase
VSVHRDRDQWRVRWREHGRQRSRTFTRKGDAQTFDLEVRRRLQLGPHLVRELNRSTLTLAEFLDDGFRSYARTLQKKTLEQYDWALQNHLRELADEPLLGLDVPRLAMHQQFLLEHGRSPNTVREAMTRLSGILQIAVEHGVVPGNAARALRKVPLPPRDEVRPLAPVELETLIAGFTGRDRAVLLLGGHLGLRPKEIRFVTWDSFDGAALTVGRARTKRGAARTRTIEVPRVTGLELKAWRLESGGRGVDPIIGRIGESGLKSWAWKHFIPAAAKLGRDDVTLYTLRHSHASACHYCGFTVPEAARRMGHSPQLHVVTYAHAIDAIKGKRYADLDALIDAARLELRGKEATG